MSTNDQVIRLDETNSGNSKRVLIEWTREGDEAAAFGTLRYRVDCLSEDREVRPWTDIENPSTPYVLNIASEDLSTINTDNFLEMKLVTVQADFGSASQKTGLIYVPVKNY